MLPLSSSSWLLILVMIVPVSFAEMILQPDEGSPVAPIVDNSLSSGFEDLQQVTEDYPIQTDFIPKDDVKVTDLIPLPVDPEEDPTIELTTAVALDEEQVMTTELVPDVEDNPSASPSDPLEKVDVVKVPEDRDKNKNKNPIKYMKDQFKKKLKDKKNPIKKFINKNPLKKIKNGVKRVIRIAKSFKNFKKNLKKGKKKAKKMLKKLKKREKNPFKRKKDKDKIKKLKKKMKKEKKKLKKKFKKEKEKMKKKLKKMKPKAKKAAIGLGITGTALGVSLGVGLGAGRRGCPGGTIPGGGGVCVILPGQDDDGDGIPNGDDDDSGSRQDDDVGSLVFDEEDNRRLANLADDLQIVRTKNYYYPGTLKRRLGAMFLSPADSCAGRIRCEKLTVNLGGQPGVGDEDDEDPCSRSYPACPSDLYHRLLEQDRSDAGDQSRTDEDGVLIVT